MLGRDFVIGKISKMPSQHVAAIFVLQGWYVVFENLSLRIDQKYLQADKLLFDEFFWCWSCLLCSKSNTCKNCRGYLFPFLVSCDYAFHMSCDMYTKEFKFYITWISHFVIK